MSGTVTLSRPTGSRAVGLAALLGLVAVALAAESLAGQLAPGAWLAAALHPATADPAELVFHFSSLPRLAVAALAGAGLAVSGGLFQHVLRNPLASPVTLGVSAGAQLALVAATVLAPASLVAYPAWLCLAGGIGSMALVLWIAAARGFSSLTLILSGLCVGLFCGALGHVLKLFNQEYLAAVFLWGAGSLAQDDWSVAETLAAQLAVLGLAAGLLIRPLRLLGLADESARGLGLSLAVYRALALGVAVGLAASVTAAVGIVGFIEIAAPLIARLAGARALGQRLAAAAAIGASMLVIVDALVQAADQRFGTALPTGAATAFLAAPLLIWLLPRMRTQALAEPVLEAPDLGRRHRVAAVLMALAALVGLAFLLAVLVGRTGEGWSIATPDIWSAVAPWRLPRAAVALAAGAMLGAAGTLLQRATGNAMASPETLGLGAAVVAGLAVALLLEPNPSGPFLFAVAALSATLLLAGLMGSGLRSRFAPDQLLLTGIALAAALDAVVFAFLALNDARAGLLLSWLAGSTAGADGASAATVLVLAVILVPFGLVFVRTLDILPLGEPLARSLGIPLGRTRLSILMLAGALTAGAVLSVGPLTFVGLIGPHITRRLGLRRAAVQLPGAALVGGGTMVLADWIGRVAIAPFEIPAGLVAALIGIPYLVVQLRRRSPSP